MRNRILKFIAVYLLIVAVFITQRPIFFAVYHSLFEGVGIGEFFGAIGHGLPHDLSMAGYLTAIPGLLLIASVWTQASLLKKIERGYFLFAAIVMSMVFITDLALYGYWGYGTDYECLMLSAMESALKSDFSLSTNEGFRKTGKYIMYMEGTTDRCFNYSDCASTLIPFPALWYLADKFDDTSLLHNEIRKLDSGLYSSYSSKKYYILCVVHGSRFDLGDIPAPQEHVYRGDGINPVCLVRTDWTFSDTDKMLGIKAGRADYSHGHMDVGSFVYDAYGMRVSADLGLQSYSSLESYPVPPGYVGDAGDFGQQAFRWAVFRYNNYNHSTITLNNALHKASGRAQITKVYDGQDRMGATVDMSDILSEDCADAERTVTIEDNTDLVVVDKIEAMYNKPADVRWTMVTTAQPRIDGNRIVLQGTERNLYLTVSTENGATVELKVFDMTLNDWDQANPGYYEAGFTSRVTSGKSETFTVRISPE